MPKQKVKAVILDCDGVILNSNKAYERLYERLFAKYGVSIKPRDIYAHFGDSPRHILKIFFPRHDTRKIFSDYKKQLNDRGFKKKIKINKGSKRAIERLSKKYILVVASGALRSRLVWSLNKFRLMGYFRFVIGSDDVKRAKPHPEMLLKIVRRLDIRKDEVIFVGDAANDLMASRRAGIKFAAVLSGILDRKTAKRMKADYIISDITKVENLMGKIRLK